MTEHNLHGWVRVAKERGWGDFARLGLDALAPLAPLGAQFVWISQPFLSLFVRREGLTSLAESLETQDGLETLRGLFDENQPRSPVSSPLTSLNRDEAYTRQASTTADE